MSRAYSPEEMREMAAEAEVIEVADQFDGHNMDTIAAMLRQAADAMEQEESDVVRCRKCQTARTGEWYGEVPPHVGEDDICDRCEIAEHLRRGKDADKPQREQKYEYAECYFTSSISTLHESSEDDVRLYASNGSTVVRRTVGEWEHLPRGCGE